MTELPLWIVEKLEFDPNKDLQQRPVAEVFIEDEKPFLSRREVQTKLKGEFTRGTVLNRLNELTEVGVLKADVRRGGTIYWINYEVSEWPVPPDVEVEPVSEELTVSEFFSQSSVTIAVLGIGLILICSLLIWTGGILAGFQIIGQNVSGGIIIAGLLGTFIGWIVTGYGIFQYFREG